SCNALWRTGRMKSVKRGKISSRAEVVHVSARGFWIFLEPAGREMYLPFEAFPWFEDATIRELSRIDVERGTKLRWPELDVDLDVAAIEHRERYPLVAKRPSGSRARVRAARKRASTK